MEERRIKLRRHIQAARAWLLQADKSLERENDVQGDLKLMLAKAELAQARGAHRSWMKKVFPPLTALMIAGAVVLSNQTPVSEEEPAVAPLETQSESEISLLEQTPTVQPDTLVEMPMREAPEPIYEAPFEEYEPLSTAEAPIEYSSAEEPAQDEYVEYYEPAYEPTALEEPTYVSEPMAVPNEDMQRLMLDAGQILRAK